MRRFCLLLSAFCLLAALGCRAASRESATRGGRDANSSQDTALIKKETKIGDVTTTVTPTTTVQTERHTKQTADKIVNTGGQWPLVVFALAVILLVFFHPGRHWAARGVKWAVRKCRNPNSWTGTRINDR